jgi:hypothetical protein
MLRRFWESFRRKRPELWPDGWIFHHDNAPDHDASRVREFLAKKSITNWTIHLFHLIAACDFWLFPKLKNTLKGQKFADVPNIQTNMAKLPRGFRKAIFKTVVRM